LYEERKKNHLLKKKLELNEQDKLDLEQQLETGIKPTRKRRGKGFGNVDLENHQQMLQEKLRKEREEMRRQLFVGIDFLGAGQLRIAQGTKRTWWKIFTGKIYKLFDAITPHKGDVKSISSKYDKAVSAYFQFFRFVVSFSILMLIVFITLLIIHSIYYFANEPLTEI